MDRDRPSRVLVRLARGLTKPSTTLGDAFDRLGGAGVGVLLLVLAVPALLPSPGLPVGAVFGAALMAVAVQMMRGRRTVGLPGALRDRVLPGGFLGNGARWSARRLAAIEGALQERLSWATGGIGRRFAGGAVFAMGVVIMLPIPFGNAPAAAAVVLIAVALMARDGAALILSYALVGVALLGAIWLSSATISTVSGWLAGS